jgi:sugar (pentulose or hexulose) kinase
MIPGIGLGTSSIKLQVIDESSSILEESTFPIDVSRLQTSLA